MKNYRTPRNLAECSFEVGYYRANYVPKRPISKGEIIGGYIAVLAIGVGLAAALVVWWST